MHEGVVCGSWHFINAEYRSETFEPYAALDLGDGSTIIYERDAQDAWIESDLSFARNEIS